MQEACKEKIERQIASVTPRHLGGKKSEKMEGERRRSHACLRTGGLVSRFTFEAELGGRARCSATPVQRRLQKPGARPPRPPPPPLRGVPSGGGTGGNYEGRFVSILRGKKDFESKYFF